VHGPVAPPKIPRVDCFYCCGEVPADGEWEMSVGCWCVNWWCKNNPICMQHRISGHKDTCVPAVGMFNNRNAPVDPSPAPFGTNCILHLGRNHGCENGLGKDLLKRAALASSHAELSVALQAVKDELGDEVYDALMANKYRYLFMYKIEALGIAETTYGGSVSNEAEQENARRKRLRALDIYKSVIETIHKMEKDHSSSWTAAQGAFVAGKKISDHATKRVINLAQDTFKYWKVKNISGIQRPLNGQGHYKMQVTLCLIKNPHLTQTVCINSVFIETILLTILLTILIL